MRRRLAGARERLRNRLVRRGFAPAASALVLSVAREAAVPAAVAEATLRAAVRVAAGEAIAAVAGTRLAGLTRAGLTIMTGSGKHGAARAVGRRDCVPGRWHRRCNGARARPARPVPSDGRQDAVPAGSRAADAGRVGRRRIPLANMRSKAPCLHPTASLLPARTCSGSRIRGSSAAGWPGPRGSKRSRRTECKTLASTSTDAAGRFELAAEFDADAFPGRMVIVKAKGSGLSGRAFFGETVKESDGKDERLTFRLRTPVTIEGGS